MHVRQAEVEDSAGMARVQVDSYRTAYADIMPQDYLDHFTYEEQEQDWRDFLSAERDDVYLVAQAEGGEIAGYGVGRLGSEIKPYDCELVSLHVHFTRQRRGIGRQLVAAMARELERRGCRALMLWVLEENRARGFYERLGGQLLDVTKASGAGPLEVAYGWPDIALLYEGELSS